MSRDPDIELGAGVRAKRLRFETKPETSVRYSGRFDAEEQQERENLPNQVEAGETYRDVRVDWRTSVRIEDEEPTTT